MFSEFFRPRKFERKNIKPFKNLSSEFISQNLFLKIFKAMLTGMNQPNDSLKRSFFFPLETIKGYENI